MTPGKPLLRILAFLMISGVVGPARGQDKEPNDTCRGAPREGLVTLPHVLAGRLDPIAGRAESDVDFFGLEAEPGTTLRLEPGPGPGVRVGAFDSECRLLAQTYPTAWLDIEVPADRRLVIAVAEPPDLAFDGSGWRRGMTYEVRVGAAPPVIGAISGRLVDALSGAPLSGARVTLHACSWGGFCLDRMNACGETRTDARGEFRFTEYRSGKRIEAQTFQVSAQSARWLAHSQTFEVQGGEQRTLPDLALVPASLTIPRVERCSAAFPSGGSCSYSAVLQNEGDTALEAAVDTLVPIGDWEPGRQWAALPPGGSLEVRSQGVLGEESPGSAVCAELLLEVRSWTTNRAILFCMEQGDAGWHLLDPQASEVVYRDVYTRARP